jgi:hypothetical protein
MDPRSEVFDAPDYEMVTLWYYPYPQNYFMYGEDGRIEYDIFRIISPNMLLVFKEKRKPMRIPCPEKGVVYELMYPDDICERYF